MPVGIATTDAFIQSLIRLTGKKVPKVILDERGRMVDAMADTFHHTMMNFSLCYLCKFLTVRVDALVRHIHSS